MSLPRKWDKRYIFHTKSIKWGIFKEISFLLGFLQKTVIF